MSKPRKAKQDEDLLPEYDFSGGVRGKHYRDYQRGHTVEIRKAASPRKKRGGTGK